MTRKYIKPESGQYYRFIGTGKDNGCEYYGTPEDVKECMDRPSAWKAVEEVPKAEVETIRAKWLYDLEQAEMRGKSL